MHQITLDLTYMPKGHTGHLVGSAAVVECIKKINNISPIKNVLQFGFNTGWSSALFFELTDTKITSIELIKEANPLLGCEILDKKFPNRHKIIWGDSQEVSKKIIKNEVSVDHFDFAFIDGGHFPEIVQNDIELCVHLGIKNFIFDDPYHANIEPALSKFDFELVHETQYQPIRHKPNRGYYIKPKTQNRKCFLSYFTLD
jgi:hypothetical protein